MKRLRSAARGAVAVEYLIAFLPVLFLFASTWQVADLFAAQLIVQRAASAAARAASVVLPDDPYYYPGSGVDSYSGERKAQIELAANLVLQASPKIVAGPSLQVEGASGNGPITVTLRATALCFPGWGNLVCGSDGQQPLQAVVRYPYYGATYTY